MGDKKELPTLDTSTTSIMGSESNIYNMKLTEASSSENPASLKSHNSDSEIHRHLNDDRNCGDGEKVFFTIGDDTTLVNINEKLVRLSSNNDDEITCSTCLDENVKRICSEIETFFMTNKEVDKHEVKEIHEGFDVVRHMEAMHKDIANYMKTDKNSGDIENIGDTCENCEFTDACEIACAKTVTEVILIPSAEAVIDTGQVEATVPSDVSEGEINK